MKERVLSGRRITENAGLSREAARWKVQAGLCFAALVTACSGTQPSTIDETFALADGQDAFAGTSSVQLLSRTEQAAYAADRAYLRGLAKRGVPMSINHADPRQHRFAIARMKMAGKTHANSPELFRLLDGLPAKHMALGLLPGQMQAQAVNDGTLASQHALRATVKTPTQGVVASGSLASRKDPLSYGYIDCSVYDGNGNALGDPSFVEIFGNMVSAIPTCTGDLEFAEVQSLEGDSFMTENLSNSSLVNQSYILGNVISLDAAQPTLGLPTVEHPVEQTGDGFIDICLQRGDGSCDYNNLGMLKLQIPLKGSISLSNGTFDPIKIGQYQRGVDSGSKIYVTLSSTRGGGCTLPPFAMTTFWNNITFTSTKLSWDLYSAMTAWPQFSSDCQLIQDRVDLTMDLNLPFNSSAFSGTLPVQISTAGAAPVAPNYRIATPIRLRNSCLAAGTRITTTGKAAQNIEDIHIGDRVSNPFTTALTVADVTVGTERTPMVQIVDSLGHELMMTEMHPLAVVDRGFVAARYLKVGDRVRTQDGTSELVSVSRKSYSGQVYNLRIGNAEEARSLEVDQTVMYANGFLVGDVQVQDKYQYMDLRDRAANDKLAVRWRTDYETSLRRK